MYTIEIDFSGHIIGRFNEFFDILLTSISDQFLRLTRNYTLSGREHERNNFYVPRERRFGGISSLFPVLLGLGKKIPLAPRVKKVTS